MCTAPFLTQMFCTDFHQSGLVNEKCMSLLSGGIHRVSMPTSSLESVRLFENLAREEVAVFFSDQLPSKIDPS
jgi:hypothetical protein